MSASTFRNRDSARSLETRERILSTTENFLVQNGLDLSIRAVTEEAGAAKAKAGVNPIPIEDIVEAVLHPYIFGPEGRENAGMIFLRIALANRVRPTDLGRALIREYLEPIAQQLLHALREALPDLSDAEIHWRYHFMISSVLATLADMEVGGRFHTLSKGECDVTDKAEILRQLVRFLSAGLRAPRGP